MNPRPWISPATRFVDFPDPLQLECGQTLPNIRVAYRTWGRRRGPRPNAVLVCHALTGSADIDRWWPGLLGPRRALDPEHDLIVCANCLGSCYGTTGPTAADFPPITVRDTVRAQARLLDHLGIAHLDLVIGGSLGGMQTLEWAALYPERVAAVAPIATTARHSPWAIGFSEAQRQAIRTDPDWNGGRYEPDHPPRRGLAAARMIAMCTYRSWAGFEARFGREQRCSGAYQVESYLRHHGEKLARRFDARAYVTLTRAMDTHDVGRGRGGVVEALGNLRQPSLVVTTATDTLYPPVEQELLAKHMPNAELVELHSVHGHDAFLIETERLSSVVRSFRNNLSMLTTRENPLAGEEDTPCVS